MCAACVAQGIGYVGTALVGLQVMGARAKSRRARSGEAGEVATPDAADVGNSASSSASADSSV